MHAEIFGKRMLVAAALVLCFQVCRADQSGGERDDTDSHGAMEWENPSHAIGALRRVYEWDADALLVQKDLDFLIPESGGGACATVAAVNLLQTLRLMIGVDALPNLHRVALEAFANQPELLKGRVTNGEFVKLIRFFQNHLDGTNVTVEVDSAPNSAYAEDKRTWSAVNGPDLTVRPRQVKVLSFTVTAAGELIGRHFVLLKQHGANEVEVFDPQKPSKVMRYVLDYRSGDKGDAERVFLLQPAGAPARSRVFELNTVFTVAIRADKGAADQALQSQSKL